VEETPARCREQDRECRARAGVEKMPEQREQRLARHREQDRERQARARAEELEQEREQSIGNKSEHIEPMVRKY